MTDPNPDSILDSVKKVLGFSPDYAAFDLDITLFINASFGSLQQLGIGSGSGFVIQDNTTLWSQYVANLSYLGMVKSYIFMMVKLAFDPPQTSFGIDAIKDQLKESRMAHQRGHRDRGLRHRDPFMAEIDDIFVPIVVQLVFQSLVTPDALEGTMFYLTMTSDCIINAPVNGADGQHITLELQSNGHSVTWGNGWNWGDAGTPTLSSDRTDVVSAYFNESANAWRAGFTPGF